MSEQERDQQIEAWLAGMLEGEALRNFEAQLAKDEELTRQLRMHQELKTFLQQSPKNELRNTLQNIRDKVDTSSVERTASTSKRWNRWMIAVLFFILLAGGGLYLSWTTLSPTSEEVTPAISVPEMKNDIEVVPSNTNEKIEHIAPVPIEQPVLQDQSKEIYPPSQDGQADVQPIAAAFIPNPLIEEEMVDMVRGGLIDLSMEQPTAGVPIEIAEGKASLPFSGTLTTNRPLDNSSLRILFYTNKVEDYQTGTYLWEHPLEVVKGQNGTYSFSYETKQALSAGLYYYFIEWVDEETYLTIDRIELK